MRPDIVQQHLDLAANYPKIDVAYTQIATISTDEHHASQEFRAPDWDLGATALREAWDAGDLSPFHGLNRWSPERAAAARSV